LGFRLKLLILGCGRGGTHYVSEVMRAMGANFGHETVCPDGMASWFMAADDPTIDHLWKDGSMRPVRVADFDTVVHQTRHPLAVIRSWQPMPATHLQLMFIEKHTSCRIAMSPLEFGMRYWLDWSRLCDEKITPFGSQYRVEGIEAYPVTLAMLSGVDNTCSPDPPFLLMSRGSKVISETPHSNKTTEELPAITWGDLYKVDFKLASEIQELAEGFGYE